jgi:hypothetical protein
LGITSADAIGSASAAVPGAGLKSFLTNYSTGDILGFVLTLVFTGIIIGAARSLGRQARADSHYSTASKNGSGVSATIAMVLLAIGLFFGLNPLIVAIAHVYAPKLGSDLLTFTTDILIVFFAWLIYVPRRVRAQSLCAFLGASEKSGIPFAEVFISFFRKPGIGRMIAFLLLYRLGEAMLVKITGPFLIKDRNTGALGLTTVDYGIAYGTIGVLMLIIGGILGGLVAARYGLKRVMFWMCLAINVPDMAYVYLAWAHPHSLVTVEFCVAIESFGYGFGFAAYMLYQLYIAGDGEHKTSHFAICTGLMALGMTLPGMISGALQEHLGYTNFFIAVCVATLPGFVTLAFIPLDPEFGKNKHTS